jgi:hypothetical protein
MQIKEVNDKATRRDFIQVVYSIYANDKKWIAHLEKDIEAVFDPTQNPAFADGEAARWVLYDDKEKAIGRVAAFFNRKGLESMDYPVGSMGFFECINDKNAAFLLFDTCRNWLEQKGMKGMDGPVNFGERDKFWGLLIQSDTTPTYQENYNPDYYQGFFEAYGFQLYFEQLTYRISKKTLTSERLEKIAGYVERKAGNRFEHLKLKELPRFARDFVYIYNSAWQKFENFKPVTEKEILRIFKDIRPIVVEDYIWFAYVNDEPAGFLVILPDVNDIFQYFRGKLGLWQKIKFLWYKRFRPIRRVKALVFGIHASHQGVGLDAVLLSRFFQAVRKQEIHQDAEEAWVGGFNPKMHSLMGTMNGEVAKVHYTYRKLFDESLPFKPYELRKYEK